MTFSLCVRESYRDGDDTQQYRFGLGVTTRLPGVGALCPFVSEAGAVAVQSQVSKRLGERTLAYLDDGLAVDDAIEALLNADDNRRNRQIHGVDTDTSVVVTGAECVEHAAHHDAGQFTVAGNLLADGSVLDAVGTAYESDAFGEQPLAERLIDALAAGVEAGGDKRESLSVGSAAIKVVTTAETGYRRFYNDLRVDASETPIDDLRTTYDAALLGYEQSLETYASPDEIEANRPD